MRCLCFTLFHGLHSLGINAPGKGLYEKSGNRTKKTSPPHYFVSFAHSRRWGLKELAYATGLPIMLFALFRGMLLKRRLYNHANQIV